MGAHLERLRGVVEGSSTEQIRREVLSVAASIGDALAARKQRQRSHVAELGDHLRTLGRQLEEARREGTLDPLTRLGNRGAFDAHVARTADMAVLFATPACLLMIDVDHFKRINDSAGHPGGDEVLRQLSNCLARTLLRKSDFLARYGGEELAAILAETGLADAAVLAERLRRAVERLVVPYQGRTLALTISIGVAELQASESASSWVARADRALYAAKAGGRNRVVRDEGATIAPAPALPAPSLVV